MCSDRVACSRRIRNAGRIGNTQRPARSVGRTFLTRAVFRFSFFLFSRTLGAKTAPSVGRPGHGDDVVALFALAYRIVVHLCAHRVLVVQLTRVVLETLFPQPCNHTSTEIKVSFLAYTSRAHVKHATEPCIIVSRSLPRENLHVFEYPAKITSLVFARENDDQLAVGGRDVCTSINHPTTHTTPTAYVYVNMYKTHSRISLHLCCL